MDQYTEIQKQEFAREFARRRKIQLILMAPMAVLAFSFVFLADQTKDGQTAETAAIFMPMAIAAIIGVVLYSLKNWRCPACNSYLGRSISPRFCPSCGAPLTTH